ncbi:MAG: hypothetical protein ACREQO_22725 [Candidatus Binatia bacterium]
MSNALVQITLPPAEFSRQEQLRHAILSYCVEHPDAKDTVEGILYWWFRAAASPRWRNTEVKQALESLIAEGWLTSRKLRQSDEIYGVKKEKLVEIETYLRRSGGGVKPRDGQ